VLEIPREIPKPTFVILVMQISCFTECTDTAEMWRYGIGQEKTLLALTSNYICYGGSNSLR